MNAPETTPAAPDLAPLREQIAALFSGEDHSVTAGHVDLGPDIWLSTDPEGRGRLSLGHGEDGLLFSLERSDTGRWCSLGMRLPVEAIVQARYVGLLVDLRADALVTYTPTLRYNLKEGGIRDVSVPTPVMAVGGKREILSHVPVDQETLAQSRECELNLFFHNDAAAMVLSRLEPLLIL